MRANAIRKLCCPWAMAATLWAMLLALPALAQETTIPVKGVEGTLPSKEGKKDVKAKGEGVFKRKKKADKLDPTYDPADATEKVGKEPKADAPAGMGPIVPRPADAKSDAPLPKDDKSDVGKVEDSVTFTTNFQKDVKCKPMSPNARISLDFQDAPIESVMKLVSCWTNRNFILATTKKGGKITILSPVQVTVYEAYKAFLSSLMVNGMSVTKKGAFYHIVDNTEARSSGADVLGPKASVPGDDNVVTRIIKLKNIDVKDAEPLAGKFKSKTGDVFTYPPNNSLIITDTGNNIQRVIKLLSDIDQPLGAEKIWIRPVQHMDASELIEKITSVFGDGKGAAAGPAGSPGATAPGTPAGNKVTMSKAIADDRSNQIILIATRANYLKIDALIRKLDVPIPGEGAIHIHHLENADAEDLASTLSSLAGGGAKSGGARGKGGAKAAKPAGGGGGAAGGGAATLFEGDVKITAHKATNALVIESSLKDYLSLQKVIAELDRRRKQVYVEAVVMEISTSKSRKTQLAGSAGTTFDIGGDTVPFLFGLGGLGMSGVSLQQLNSGGFAAGLQGPLLQLNAGNTGTGTSAVPAGVTLSIPAFGFLVQAIQENSDVNVLSTPHILTLNNEDAEISVGRKIPYRSQTMGGLPGLGGMGGLGGMMGGIPGAAGALGGLGMMGGMLGGMMGGMVQFLDVDLTLKITPQINESDFIKLKIDQQLDEVEGIDPNLGPTTSKRKISNTVVVRDQQPVVIGGLVTDRETSGVAKIPILGDLPLLGMFFRKNTLMIEKKNLMLIVVPHIIKDPTDLERLHQTKMEQIRAFADELATKQKEYQGKVDYRKKHGFLEGVFQAVDKAVTERKLQEKAYFDNADVDLVGPPEHHDLEFDPFKHKPADKKADRPADADDVQVIELPEAPEAGEGSDKPAKPEKPDQPAKPGKATHGGESTDDAATSGEDGAATGKQLEQKAGNKKVPDSKAPGKKAPAAKPNDKKSTEPTPADEDAGK